LLDIIAARLMCSKLELVEETSWPWFLSWCLHSDNFKIAVICCDLL